VRIKIRAATNSEVAVLVRESLSDNVASISDWRAILGRLRLSASDSCKITPERLLSTEGSTQSVVSERKVGQVGLLPGCGKTDKGPSGVTLLIPSRGYCDGNELGRYRDRQSRVY